MKSQMNMKVGNVRSKTRSLDQILEKACVSSIHQIFDLILMKFGQSFCLDDIVYILENESCQVKSMSLGQIIENPMLVTKGLCLNPCSLMLYYTIRKAQVSDSRATMALLYFYCGGCYCNRILLIGMLFKYVPSL